MTEQMPWLHVGHNPIQHRDRQPPWCNACGYTNPVPAIEAKQIKVIEPERVATLCTHCGEKIEGTLHVTGPQTSMHRCAVEPYGYNAHPVGTPCAGTGCRGDITKVYRDERSLT